MLPLTRATSSPILYCCEVRVVEITVVEVERFVVPECVVLAEQWVGHVGCLAGSFKVRPAPQPKIIKNIILK